MKKIKFTIKQNILFVDYKNEENSLKNINRTNIINDEDLIFDTKYLKSNTKLVSGFLNVLVLNEKVDKCVVKDKDLVELTLDILNGLPSITSLVIEPDVPIDYKMHLAILRNDTLKYINCYTIPIYLLENIDSTKSVKIKTRNEVFFVSNFIRLNELNSYSDVFYKRKVIIKSDFNEMDWKDFDIFLSINKHLKTISFDYLTMDLLKLIMTELKKYHLENILVSIQGNDQNLKLFDDLEKFVKNNKYAKKHHIKFRIDYTGEYQRQNFLKLLNFTTMRYILVAIIISCLLGYGLNEYDIYKSSQAVNHISDNIDDVVESAESTQPESQSESQAQSNNNNGYVSPYYKNYSQIISVLKETNPDTVGWLTVNNTRVSYPVVQSTNNSYYLAHDFNRNSNSLGWVFMDYRNNPTDLDSNTIIYGHNIAKARLMFGDLKQVLNQSWYTNPNNQYITFNIAGRDIKWRIFAIYKVQATNDYLYTKFGSEAQFLEFANKMKSRSIYDFGVTLKGTDKMLTLSTCQTLGSGKGRLVVHAVMQQ